jgi:cytochrome c oxidase subunit 3
MAEKKPLEVMVYFALAGITTLFIGLTMAFMFSRGPEWPVPQIPKTFWLSTVLVVASSVLMERSWQVFQQDDLKQLMRFTLGTAVLGLGFLVFQALGLRELIQAGYPLSNGQPAGAYIHLLAWLHGLHLLVGIALVATLTVKATKLMGDPVKALLYFADDNRKVRFRAIRLYWHAIGVIWAYLFFFLLFFHS